MRMRVMDCALYLSESCRQRLELTPPFKYFGVVVAVSERIDRY